ncbi:hypothetical protein BT93_L1917 [Corymbia citriodora subsp. variegata]|uniref:non-specific serine/threonine protein kinase n=1 Tax=Corymbia citriodora subsp. variegata TaxID=360336 RepID=A0A8T0CLM2_CORYI|nr:hypothetical protein BT93_L1917 [Corymbia citriodora subsp. variegata]
MIPSRFASPFLILLLLFLLLPPLTIAIFWNGPSSLSVPAAWTPSKLYDFDQTINTGFRVVLSRLNSGPNMKNLDVRAVWLVHQEYVNDTSQMLLTQDGDLVLQGLNLTEVGNLVLYDRNDAVIWQSFDNPAKAILPGQELRPSVKLTTTSYLPNEMARTFTFTTDDQIGFVTSVMAAYSPQIYYNTSDVCKMTSDSGQVGALYKNGTFGEFDFPPTSLPQYIILDGDGHLRQYVHVYDELSWKPTDLLQDKISFCNYPLVCGSYGICSQFPDSVCPNETKQIVARYPSSGCDCSSPFSSDSYHNTFVEVERITCFALLNNNISANISNATAESCKKECLRKGRSCTMALLSEQFSLIDDSAGYYSTLAFIKVSTLMPLSIFPRKRWVQMVLMRGTTVGALSMFLVSIFGIYISRKVRRNDIDNDDPDLPRLQITRFLYDDVKVMTRDFTVKLGEGGFGSVFLGTLPSCIKIAVKRLDGFDQIKKSFLAEAGTIGTIHHVNLVKLLGFCAKKSYRLLVYQYMCNGSLDKWILHKDEESGLCWQVRRKIILDVAKGLAYLHEECHQKIIHLDIKPHNILLDEHFNAKLADFGSIITKKVDVYSFGIVMLEVLCRKKNVGRSLPSDEVHMLTLFKWKAEQEHLLDMVDKSSGDMQLHGQEAVKMMKIAAWCLQDDCSKRLPMSQVVKCLEGLVDVEDGLRYSFSVPSGHSDHSVDDATQLLPSQLSGPR